MIPPGYIVALGLTFLVPQLYTSIAFDSGGVASGAMTSTFLLPLAMGACRPWAASSLPMPLALWPWWP